MSLSDTSLLKKWNWFLAATADACEQIIDQIRKPRRIIISEAETGRFVALNGDDPNGSVIGTFELSANNELVSNSRDCMFALAAADAEVHLNAERFFLRELSLPKQAGEFLDRILATQIDQLTPWPVQRVMFGHQKLNETGDKLQVIVAAADRDRLMPIVSAFTSGRPRALKFFAPVQGEVENLRVPVFQTSIGFFQHAVLERALGVGLLGLSALVFGTYVYSTVVGWNIDTRYLAVQTSLADRRSATRTSDPTQDAERALIQRKMDGPVATLVLEDVTRLVPDNSWLTEIEMTGSAVRISGIAPDATALVGLIEKSSGLSDARFFAPTTRSASDNKDLFFIEARVKPRRSASP